MQSCSTVKLNSCVFGGRERERERKEKKKPPWTCSSRKACISSQERCSRSICPVTSQGAVCARAQAISVRNGHMNCVPHLWTVGHASAAERTEVVGSIASCLFFLFPLPSLPVSCLSCGEQGDRSTIHVPVESPVQFCQSVSLSPWRSPSTDHCTALLSF